MRDFMLIIHFIGIAMAIGAGFSNQFLGYSISKLPPAERGPFMAKVMVLIVMGRIGLGLLLISGFYLISPYWKVLSEMPWLMAKLILVGVLVTMVIVVSIVAAKARKQGNPTIMAKLRPIGILNFLIGVVILILAVLSFH